MENLPLSDKCVLVSISILSLILSLKIKKLLVDKAVLSLELSCSLQNEKEK